MIGMYPDKKGMLSFGKAYHKLRRDARGWQDFEKNKRFAKREPLGMDGIVGGFEKGVSLFADSEQAARLHGVGD